MPTNITICFFYINKRIGICNTWYYLQSSVCLKYMYFSNLAALIQAINIKVRCKQLAPRSQYVHNVRFSRVYDIVYAAEDAFSQHSGRPFSTKDRDNDGYSDRHCAQVIRGAWWYHSCSNCHLNGPYYSRGSHPSWGQGVVWCEWNNCHSLKKVVIKLRP